MPRLLIVEDHPNDLQIAVEVARSAGVDEVEARTSVLASISYLERGLKGEIPLPDCIILDLDLGYESGYELLRFWHSNPALKAAGMIVWTLLGEEQREICKLFNIQHYVSKWEGTAALRDALRQVQSGRE